MYTPKDFKREGIPPNFYNPHDLPTYRLLSLF